MIDENKLIEEIRKMFKPLTTADGSSYIDELIQAHNETLYDVLKTIEEQPKVNEWIPVEERLPDKGKDVIVTYIGYNTGGRFSNGTAFYDFGKWWWSINDSIVKVKIIAWMPLPKEYEKE